MKKLYFPFAFFLFCITTIFNSSAQPFYYNFYKTTATYSNLLASTSLNNNLTWTDPHWAVPLGFNFDFFGTQVNTLYVDGHFGGGVISANPNGAAGIGVSPLIIAYGSDLCDRGILVGSSNSLVSYKLEGAIGNHILKVEWKSVGFQNEVDLHASASWSLNYQLWLYEATGNIEIHMGPSAIGNSSEAHGGFPAPILGLVDFYDYAQDTLGRIGYVHGNPNLPTMIISNVEFPDVSTEYLWAEPGNGPVYGFTTAPADAKDPFQQFPISVYPSPASEFLFFDIPFQLKSEISSISILDIFGRNLMDGMDPNEDKIDISMLQPGMYFLIAEGENTSQSVRFIVE